jgi:hypothetical protein
MSRVLWRAFGHAPDGLDALIHLGRRHVLPLLRHRLPVYRLTGTTSHDRAAATVVTIGTSMTLDWLVQRFFHAEPHREVLRSTSVFRLHEALERLTPTADLVLACVPRVSAGWLGDAYLRVPALVGARLPVGDSLSTTLANATRSVHYNARHAVANGYTWSFSDDAADFEVFYDDFYRPFVLERFGQLAVVQQREVLRRHFRQNGGIMWIRHCGRVVGGLLVRERGRCLLTPAEGVDPAWPAMVKPSVQFVFYLAAIDVALNRGLASVDLGTTVPCLWNGVFRMKRSLGAIFEESADSHRDILVRWRTPYGPAVQTFFHVGPLLFASSSGLCALASPPLDKSLDGKEIDRPEKQLMAEGIKHIFVLGQSNTYGDSSIGHAGLEAVDLLDPSADAMAINHIARKC